MFRRLRVLVSSTRRAKDTVFHPSLNSMQTMCGQTQSRLNVLIHSNQQQMHLHKITVISGITLRAHFSLGIAKFDTLPKLLRTLDTSNNRSILSNRTVSSVYL